MLRSDLCDYSDVYIVVKGEVTATWVNKNSEKISLYHFKTMLHLLIPYQKPIMY